MTILLAGRFDWNKLDLKNVIDDLNIIICNDEDEDEMDVNPAEVDAIVCNWYFKYHDIHRYENLKYIQLLSTGYNGIDPEEVKGMGIELHNAKGIYSVPMAEFVVGNILLFYKRYCCFVQQKSSHDWKKKRDIEEILDKKILIIGTGDVGTETAKRLRGFTDYLYGCNRTVKDIDYFDKIYLMTDLPEILPEMDIIVTCVALTPDTKNLLDYEMFSKMKRSVLVVNVSRGEVINEKDIIFALENNMIGGAILDVFEEEPLSYDSKLWELDNVIITPHNSFVSNRNEERISAMIMYNLGCWVDNYG